MNKLAQLAPILAWVLWAETQVFSGGVAEKPEWSIIRARESELGCETQLASMMQLDVLARAFNTEASTITRGRRVATFHDAATKQVVGRVKLICLPDTVDPRPRP